MKLTPAQIAVAIADPRTGTYSSGRRIERLIVAYVDSKPVVLGSISEQAYLTQEATDFENHLWSMFLAGAFEVPSATSGTGDEVPA